jgi:hypothetical protein
VRSGADLPDTQAGMQMRPTEGDRDRLERGPDSERFEFRQRGELFLNVASFWNVQAQGIHQETGR